MLTALVIWLLYIMITGGISYMLKKQGMVIPSGIFAFLEWLGWVVLAGVGLYWFVVTFVSAM